MKTVHEFFTNLRRMEYSRFEYSWFYSWMVVFAQVEGLRGRMSEAGMQAEGLFESLLAEAFEA